MSQLGVDGFRAERLAILEVGNSLSADEWSEPSDCTGWMVRDVFGHMAATLHGVVDPTKMADLSGGTEQGMEKPVSERRALDIADVLDEYETYSGQAADIFASLQDPSLDGQTIPMGELGTHPLAMVANTFLFDAYTHLRADVLQPNGPIVRTEPPRDEQRLRPTVEWMIAGLPWMCANNLAFIDRPVTLKLDGPGGGTWTLNPRGAEERIVISEGEGKDAAATIASSDHDFVVWGTKRRPWAGYVKVEGDEQYAARVLDAINVI